MNTTTNLPSNKSPHLLIWIVGIAVILFSAAGIAAIMGWIPTSMGRNADNTEVAAPPKVAATEAKPAAARPRTPTEPHAARPGTSTEPRVASEHVARNAPMPAKCAECGTIESINTITKKGTASGLGAVGGAVVGGLIGNQVGSGRGNTAATVIGAVGGAVGGNEIEKRVKSDKDYEVTVRMNDGSSRVITEANQPAWRTGDHVKIVGGAIQSN